MKYYLYSRKGDGPFTMEELSLFNLEKQDLVKSETEDFWVEIEKVPELAPLFEMESKNDDIIGQVLSVDDAIESDFQASEGTNQAVDDKVIDRCDSNVSNSLLSTFKNLGYRKLVPLFLVLALLIAFLSNPTKKDHYPVVKSMVDKTIGQNRNGVTGDPFFDMFFDNFGFFDNMMQDRIMSNISWHNGYLFSYCSFKNHKGHENMVSFGMFGCIFSLNQEKLNNYVYGKDSKEENEDSSDQKPKKQKPQTPNVGEGVTL